MKCDIFTVRNEVAKVMFLHLCVCPQGGGSASVHAGYHPTSQEQAPPRAGTLPGNRHPQADGYCCGRYASYWNAFLSIEQFWWLIKVTPYSFRNIYFGILHKLVMSHQVKFFGFVILLKI